MNGELLPSLDKWGFPLVWDRFKDYRCGNLIVISTLVHRTWKSNRAYLLTRCLECQKEFLKDATSIKIGKAGCGKCGRRRNSSKPVLDVPQWLLNRCITAKQRCTNPNELSFYDYGGRGIEFRFASPSLMGRWIMDNIGNYCRELQIDRIDNDGHYEQGNLRMVRPCINMNNQRTSWGTKQRHLFRTLHPDVKYADSTLTNMLFQRMTFEEIVDRFYNLYSCKPKGMYGTFSTPDLEIVLLARE